MKKKNKLSKTNITLITLLFLNMVLFAYSKTPLIAKLHFYSFLQKHHIFKKETSQIKTFHDTIQPHCFFTIENPNKKQACIENNGIWLQDIKNCVCRHTQVI